MQTEEMKAMETMMQSNVERLLQDAASNQAEHESFKRRLTELDERTRKQTDILITLEKQNSAIEKMGTTLTDVKNSVDDVSKRVKTLEIEPANKWKKMGFEILKWLVLAIVAFVAGLAVKGI